MIQTGPPTPHCDEKPLCEARAALGILNGLPPFGMGGRLGGIDRSLGHPEAILGPYWGHIGPSWGDLGVLGLSYLDLPAGPGICWASLAEIATEDPPNSEQSVKSLVSPTCARENEKFPV